MSELIVEVAKQVPALAVLVWLVSRFLKFLSSEGKEQRASMSRLSNSTDRLCDWVEAQTGEKRDRE